MVAFGSLEIKVVSKEGAMKVLKNNIQYRHGDKKFLTFRKKFWYKKFEH